MSFESDREVWEVCRGDILPGCSREFGEIKITIKQIVTNQDKIEKKIDRFTESLLGNGKPGINVRLDRIEQLENRRKWLTRAILIAIIGIGVKMLVAVI